MSLHNASIYGKNMGNFIVRVSHVGAVGRQGTGTGIPQEITPELARAISRAAETTRQRWKEQNGRKEKGQTSNKHKTKIAKTAQNIFFKSSSELIANFVLTHEKLEKLMQDRLSSPNEKRRMLIAEQIHQTREKRNRIFNQVLELGLHLEIFNHD